MKALLFIAILVSVVACGRITVSRGDFVLNYNEFPFLALLTIGNSMCTGELISKSSVLTAGHCSCASSPHPSKFRVILGALDLYGGEAPLAAKQIFINPKYRQPCIKLMMNRIDMSIVNSYDNTIIKLAQSVDFGYYTKVRIAKLDFINEVQPGTRLRIAGYGKDTKTTSSLNSGVLKKGELYSAECPRHYAHERPICVMRKSNLQNVEVGDSGGPIMRYDTHEIVGTVSGEVGLVGVDGSRTHYDIYSSVLINRNFIIMNM